MKKTLVFLFLLIGYMAHSQKVVKPAGNTKDSFSLSINGTHYKTYVEAFVNRPVYKKQWLSLIEKLPVEKRNSLKGTAIFADVKLLISVQHDGKVYVENHYSVSSDTSIVTEKDIELIVERIRLDLRKEIKQKGVVTPAFSTYHNYYVNDETVLENKWIKEL